MMAGGRSRPKFMSTITSVPPASGIASGRSAFIVSASASERGSSPSTADCLLYRRRGVSHRPEQGLSAQYQVFIRCGLARRVADATRTGHEQHSSRDVMGEYGGIVAGAAPQFAGRSTQLTACLGERLHQQGVHRRRRHPGQQLELGTATLLSADGLQPCPKRVDRLPDHALFEMAHLQRELGATGNHIHAAGFEMHHPDVGHGLGVSGQYQVLELAGCSGRRPTGIVAQPEWRRAGVVLRSNDLDPLTVDSDDAGNDGEVDAVRFHPRTLLDVQLDKRPDRVQVLLRLSQTIGVQTCRCQDLRNGNALPILAAAQPADIQLAHQGQASDAPGLEANALLVGKPDDPYSLRHRGIEWAAGHELAESLRSNGLAVTINDLAAADGGANPATHGQSLVW